MSSAKDKQERIRQRIAASQDRLTRDSEVLPALPPRKAPADAYPPEDWRTLAREHPWLVVAAGAGAGLLVGALIPRKTGSKLGSRALGLVAAGAELALALGRNARDAAAENARDGLARLDEETVSLRRRAGAAAGAASRSARSTGVKLAAEAIRIAAQLRR